MINKKLHQWLIHFTSPHGLVEKKYINRDHCPCCSVQDLRNVSNCETFSILEWIRLKPWENEFRKIVKTSSQGLLRVHGARDVFVWITALIAMSPTDFFSSHRRNEARWPDKRVFFWTRRTGRATSVSRLPKYISGLGSVCNMQHESLYQVLQISWSSHPSLLHSTFSNSRLWRSFLFFVSYNV
jgi:hypothetical protein